MTSNKDNIIFEKTSFLQGGNSPFIKELYLKYINDPKSIPESWVEFFNGLDEDQDIWRAQGSRGIVIILLFIFVFNICRKVVHKC